MMATSTFLMVTGSPLIPTTQADSHGAGHNRPVNSGKLFVACNCSIACRQSCRQTRSFHSGIRLPSGRPWWQNGMPQSMQRPACALMTGSTVRPILPSAYTSCQSRTRSATGRRVASTRSVVRNPRGSAMSGLHDRLERIPALPRGIRTRDEHALVVARHDLGQPRDDAVPGLQQAGGKSGAGLLLVPHHEVTHQRDVVVVQRFDVDHAGVDSGGLQVQHVGDTAGHPGSDIAPGAAEDQRRASGHVLARVVAGSFDDGGDPGVEGTGDHACEYMTGGTTLIL